MRHEATHVIAGQAHIIVSASPAELAEFAKGNGWRKTETPARAPGATWRYPGGKWQHISGATIEHCGHPTANYPYLARQPDGRTLILTPSGRAFGTLKLAKAAVEQAVFPPGGAA